MKINNDYQCVIFVKNKNEAKQLKSGTSLYGQVNKTSKTVFLTPYAPPFELMGKMGVISEKPTRESELINVYRNKNTFTALTYISNAWIELPIAPTYCKDLYARTPFKETEMQHLAEKNVLIIGGGTGGSKIAVELARAGVGGITICDPDTFQWANVSRHEGDILDVGKSKVQIVAERVYRTNPSITIDLYDGDIFERSIEFLKSLFSQYDLIIAATDITAIQLTINELVHRFKIPCVFGGCYEEALGGEVFYTLPDENMPCLSCLRGGLQQPQKSGSIDYSTAKNIEDYEGQPGLHAMVDFVTCTEILISLGILLRDVKDSKLSRIIDPSRNFLLVGGILGAGFYRFKKAFDVFYQPLKGHRKDCLVCGKRIN